MTDHRRSGHVEPPAPGEASRERTALIGLLDSGVTAITDGGDLVSAVLDPISGTDVVARFFVGVYERQPDLVVREKRVNGQPGMRPVLISPCHPWTL